MTVTLHIVSIVAEHKNICQWAKDISLMMVVYYINTDHIVTGHALFANDVIRNVPHEVDVMTVTCPLYDQCLPRVLCLQESLQMLQDVTRVHCRPHDQPPPALGSVPAAVSSFSLSSSSLVAFTFTVIALENHLY